MVVRESSNNIFLSEISDDPTRVLVDSCIIAVLIALISILEFKLPTGVAGLCSLELSFPSGSPSKYDRA